MLANVVALVGRAKNEVGEPEVVFQTLVKRIKALSHTHNVLTDQNWRGADLRSIIEPELLGVYGADRITLRGPDVVLNAKSTVALGMTFHEMATNAAKYGALSNQKGRLTVSWAKLDEGDGDLLVLRWVEQDGPPAKEPTTTGFGTQLIDSTIRSSLRGSIEKNYEVGGFSAEIRLPMDGITRAYDEDEFA
jgi:two-component system CheB/CheR fusion protein